MPSRRPVRSFRFPVPSCSRPCRPSPSQAAPTDTAFTLLLPHGARRGSTALRLKQRLAVDLPPKVGGLQP
jgi:hypothetical protein